MAVSVDTPQSATRFVKSNWTLKGAYIVGAKDPIYDGNPLVNRSGGTIIYVAANYRLGGFGFLAGSSVENDSSAVANAGLWDQRAVLEWIQKYISLVNGDPNDVSVWGESAGAGSVLHHLVAFGGKEPALFKKAIIQSPWNVVQYDRKGLLERQFNDFAKLLGCKGKGIGCMRQKDSETVRKAADKINARDLPGHYGFG